PLRTFPALAGGDNAPLRMAALEGVASEGNHVVGQATLDVQVLDDPEEFQDPRPDAGRLEEIASASGGQVLRRAEALATLVGSYPIAQGESVVYRAPVWDRPALWLLLLTLLAAEWILRRWWGLA